MNCQILFLEKEEKISSICCLPNKPREWLRLFYGNISIHEDKLNHQSKYFGMHY